MIQIKEEILNHPILDIENCKLPPLPEGYVPVKQVKELEKKYAGNEEVLNVLKTYKWYFEVLSIVVKYYEKVSPLMHQYRSLINEILDTNTQLTNEVIRLRQATKEEVSR
jgi:hypothetical protein